MTPPSKRPIPLTPQELALIRASGVAIQVTAEGLAINGTSLADIRAAYEHSTQDLFSRYNNPKGLAVVGAVEYTLDKRAIEIYANLVKQGYSHDEIVRILSSKEVTA
ncbi:MAG: hypothetical protein MN733_13515 [Nitrososphaera sp.]|nr:hypothetical protein [Nitrososphaera sp.]